jgi:hypothetical protein
MRKQSVRPLSARYSQSYLQAILTPIKPITFGSAITFPQNQKLTQKE